ncbi:MAG: hypothetical protein EHM32_05935 [Spirochaetales bacterium]|nr:MAG: hypothetical protein EHM32_05935 [Spirochaetales bacterium]
MPELHNLIMFAAASVLLIPSPGPDNIFVLTQSMLSGAAAGFRLTPGLCIGPGAIPRVNPKAAPVLQGFSDGGDDFLKEALPITTLMPRNFLP